MVAAAVVGGATLVGGAMSASSQKKAAQTGADAQIQSAQMGIDAQERQFSKVQELLNPFVTAGRFSLIGQQDLLGLNGKVAEQNALNRIQSSPTFTALQQQGEDAILQNASATGGLRGGNVQRALAEFRPQLLAQMIDQEYSRLGGITSLGQNAAAGVGNAGMQTGAATSSLLQQQGAAQAGAALAAGRATAGFGNSLSSAAGLYGAFGGFKGWSGFGTPASTAQVGGAAGAYGAPTPFGVAPGSDFGSLGSGFSGMNNPIGF